MLFENTKADKSWSPALWHSCSSRKYGHCNTLLRCDVISLTVECGGRKEQWLWGYLYVPGPAEWAFVTISFGISQDRLSFAVEQISPNLSLCPTHTTRPTWVDRKLCSHSHSEIQATRHSSWPRFHDCSGRGEMTLNQQLNVVAHSDTCQFHS